MKRPEREFELPQSDACLGCPENLKGKYSRDKGFTVVCSLFQKLTQGRVSEVLRKGEVVECHAGKKGVKPECISYRAVRTMRRERQARRLEA